MRRKIVKRKRGRIRTLIQIHNDLLKKSDFLLFFLFFIQKWLDSAVFLIIYICPRCSQTNKNVKKEEKEMGWSIFSLILTIAGFVALGIGEGELADYEWKLRPRQLLCLLALLLIIPSFITKVPANSVGIKYSPFSGTSETTLSEGFHSKNPFDKVYKISTEVQTKSIEGLTTQTKDSQYVTTALDIKYRVSPENAFLVFKQYRTLERMSEKLIIPSAQRVLELITINYNVIGVLGEQRADIYKKLETNLKEELSRYGVEFYSVTIVDMEADPAIENAITAEAVAKKAVETAEQELLKAETEAKQKSMLALAEQDAAKIQAETLIIEAEANAQIKLIEAQAESDALVIAATAEKTANEMLRESLTDEVLAAKWIERWSGLAPTYYGGDGADLIFNTGKLE